MRALAWSSLVLVACTSEVGWQGGTGVGNPGSTKLTLARGHDLVITSATGTLGELVATRCDGDPAVVAIDAEVDLLAGTAEWPVPGGWWCALEARFAPPLRIDAVGGDGSDPNAGTLALELEVESVLVPLDERWIDGPHLVLELGHHEWLRPEDVGGLPDGVAVRIGEGDPGHDPLVARIEDGSALFVDTDADGVLSVAERSPLGAGPVFGEEDP